MQTGFSANQLQGDSSIRVEHDFYPTPDYATIKLLEKEKITGVIWECACGDGAISKHLEKLDNVEVLSSDLINRGYGLDQIDFLKDWDFGKVDTIITNPPYQLAEEFIHKALSIAEDKVIMLLKLNFLGGQKRYNTIYTVNPPSRVYVFSKRLNFDRGTEKAKSSGGLLEYSWFVWDKKSPTKETKLDWLF